MNRGADSFVESASQKFQLHAQEEASAESACAKSGAAKQIQDVSEYPAGDPLLWTILLGVSDPQSPLHRLHGVRRDIVSKIYVFLCNAIARHIVRDTVAAIYVTTVRFPKPTGLMINMMPFQLDNLDSLPANLAGYSRLLMSILRYVPMEERESAIGYLTINESTVAPGETQRRPGIHIDSPVVHSEEVGVSAWHRQCFGEGYYAGGFHGGIYLASSVPDTTALWNVQLGRSEELLGDPGSTNLDHLRCHLDQATIPLEDAHVSLKEFDDLSLADYEQPFRQSCKKNHVYWITDTTPHEALPAALECGRQFVRVIVGKVGVWWAEDSTANPKVSPGPETIILGSKWK